MPRTQSPFASASEGLSSHVPCSMSRRSRSYDRLSLLDGLRRGQCVTARGWRRRRERLFPRRASVPVVRPAVNQGRMEGDLSGRLTARSFFLANIELADEQTSRTSAQSEPAKSLSVTTRHREMIHPPLHHSNRPLQKPSISGLQQPHTA
jgi:hypothetical protein